MTFFPVNLDILVPNIPLNITVSEKYRKTSNQIYLLLSCPLSFPLPNFELLWIFNSFFENPSCPPSISLRVKRVERQRKFNSFFVFPFLTTGISNEKQYRNWQTLLSVPYLFQNSRPDFFLSPKTLLIVKRTGRDKGSGVLVRRRDADRPDASLLDWTSPFTGVVGMSLRPGVPYPVDLLHSFKLPGSLSPDS